MKKEHNATLNSGGGLASRSDGNPDARHPFRASKRSPTIMQHDSNKNDSNDIHGPYVSMLKNKKHVLYYIFRQAKFCNCNDMTMQLQCEQRWTHQ